MILRTAYAAVLCAALLTGCNRSARQQRLILEGLSTLQQEVNAGTGQCAQLRTAAGVWRSFSTRSISRLSGEPVAFLVVGDAVFENGTYRLETYWRLNNGRAEFYALELGGNGKRISIPPLPPAQRKLLDTPPPPYSTQRSSA